MIASNDSTKICTYQDIWQYRARASSKRMAESRTLVLAIVCLWLDLAFPLDIHRFCGAI